LKKIVQNGLFLQSERESVDSFLVVTFHQLTTVERAKTCNYIINSPLIYA